MLLLKLVREVDESVPVLIFQDWFSREHKKWVYKVISDLKLVAFSYRPNMLEYSDSGSIVSLYPFGASLIPVISDVVHTNECGLDHGRKVLNKAPLASFLWDVVFTGSRKTDTHPLVPQLDFTGTNIVTPLWELSDSDVGEPTPTSSDAHYCVNCLAPAGRTVFCPKLNRNIESIGTP